MQSPALKFQSASGAADALRFELKPAGSSLSTSLTLAAMSLG